MNDSVIRIGSPYLKFGYRKHCGNLKESLATSVYIRSENFMRMLLSGRFTPYAFDERCNQLVFLSADTSTWLFLEISI